MSIRLKGSLAQSLHAECQFTSGRRKGTTFSRMDIGSQRRRGWGRNASAGIVPQLSTEGSATERRRRRLTRAVPIVVIAAAAFLGGIVVASSPAAPAAQRFLDAWESGDAEAMYAELTPEAQEEFSLEAFTRTYDDAAASATIAELSAGEVTEQGDGVVAPVIFETHIFGNLGGELVLPISDDKVAWTPNLVYPGLATDERLSRRTRAPSRAAILAADRTPLSEGPAAARTVGTAALAVVGEVGTPTRAQERELALARIPARDV